jgi:hypothetical protein
MLVAETVLALSVVCTLPKRRVYSGGEVSELVPYVITTDTTPRSFQMADGVSLERKLTDDIENIQGVVDVRVKQVNGVLEVSVVLENLEFPLFEKVTQKELDLFDQFPDMPVRFNVVPQQADQAAIRHAA